MFKLATQRLGTTVLLVSSFVLVAGCKSDPPAAEAPSPAVATTTIPAKPPAHPYTKRHIYDEDANPTKDIAAAVKQAKREHKRVILDFGGDWCGDCQVLDIYFRETPNDALLAKNFVLAHVFVNSQIDNPSAIAIGEKYGVPLKKGVPALAVLDADGKVIYAQTGQFEDMRHMDAQSVTDFLNHWKS